MVKVRIKRSQLDRFRLKARNSKVEQIAYLIGEIPHSTIVTVSQIAYPKPMEQTPDLVSVSVDEWKRVRDKAESQGLQIVGMIHSHPNWWPVKSDQDHATQLIEGLRVSGVCAVMNRRTKVYFWLAESSLPCEIEYL